MNKGKENKPIKVKFHRVDSYNRPVFKDIEKNRFYGALNKLFSYTDSENKVCETVCPEDLVYFGNSFDCEPMGTPVEAVLIILRTNKQEKCLKRELKAIGE